VKRKDRKS